ncbi:hypothetical protein BH09GEM1_BH09GEM1_27760 [soil metagenome]
MKLFVRTTTVAVLAVAVSSVLPAQQLPAVVPAPIDTMPVRVAGGTRVDLPLLDAPFNLANGGRAPSMAQSLAVSEAFYEVAHTAIQRAWGSHTILAGISLELFNEFGGLLPGGDAWMHEEFHRAALGNRGVGSFNDVYKLNLGADVINVSHVTDADLVRFKAQHPTDFIRAAAAGIEGENQLIEGLEKSRFFRDSHSNNVSLYWMTKINSAWYVWSGISGDADSLTAEANRLEGADVAKRDWVGHDFTAWVHDLFRPDEPYTARGIDRSGVGINRYVKASDLTPQEHDFLEREGRLQLINLLDPNLFAFGGVTVRDRWRNTDMRVNVSASHYLTSFGHTIDMNVFLREGAANVFVALHRYTNGARSMPGVDVQVLDAPVTVAGRELVVSPRAALWMQPLDQAFRTTASQVGGLVSLRIRPATAARMSSFVELEAKTAGWVAGTVQLDRNVSVRIGGSVRLN